MNGRPSAQDDAELALRSGHWAAARDGFRARLATRAVGTDYEGLAQAMWWLDDGTACLEARESAYRAHRDAGDRVGAARAAAALGYDSLLFGEGASVARGWLGQAAQLLDGEPEAPEHGWLALREAEVALATSSDPEIARQAAARAAAVGRRVGDADLAHAGDALGGLAQIMTGSPASAVQQLDVAAAAATAGDVHDLMWMGKIVCWLIIACQETADLTRAQEWCRRVEIICRRQHLDPLFTVCRIQHSSILIARGTWSEAEADLTAVLERTIDSRRHARVDAVIQLGELRRRQGRIEEAEALLVQAEFDPLAIVARAHILVTQGRPDDAWGAMRAVLQRTPPSHHRARARLLLPAVRAALAAGDRAAAATAAAELRAMAADGASTALLGAAAAATALLAEPGQSPQHWLEAVRRYHDAQLPFEEAGCRLELARAHEQAGDDASAAEHAAIAAATLRALGAAAALSDAERLRDRASGGATGVAHDLTDRELEVLRLLAAGQTNQQIAGALVVSPHTVHRHVANILTKLDQPSRAGAATFAAVNGLL
ncbi:helix-turn-helix transcriptional regulator [Agrococcus sp. ProA11]|uniref:helix-turn-helix transcriptional regulator n=1 Tax=Agrococcus chionoecetis TaxID=3153752 RepID=UPI003260726A